MEALQRVSTEQKPGNGHWELNPGVMLWVQGAGEPSVQYFRKESKPSLLEMKTWIFSLSRHLEMFLLDSAGIWGAQRGCVSFVQLLAVTNRTSIAVFFFFFPLQPEGLAKSLNLSVFQQNEALNVCSLSMLLQTWIFMNYYFCYYLPAQV